VRGRRVRHALAVRQPAHQPAGHDRELTRLNELHLDYNRLTALPDTAGNLTNLIDLYVDDDVFEALPESLRDLPGYL
jgi:Leucine-rich repeat (LRR) protein